VAYHLEILPAAERALKKLAKPVARKVAAKIRALANDPMPSDAAKVKGQKKGENFWRVRVGEHRIVYDIKRKRLVVVVVGVGKRDEIYRRLKMN
jgi:mRNA interferase RelE/StbE